MKFLNPTTYLSILFISMATIFSACEGDQGEPGPAGAQGEQGTKGDKGDAGEGFEDATSLGNIKVTVEGIDPKGNTFSKQLDFKYSLPDLDLSSVYFDGETEKGFNVARFSHPIVANYESDPDVLYYNLYEWEVEGSKEYDQYVSINTTISNNLKYFYFEASFGEWYLEGEDFDITSYTYNPETGVFTFTVNVTIPAEYNNSGSEVTLKLEGNVIVYEYVQSESDDFGRMSKEQVKEKIMTAFKNALKK
ncbi:collagen-like triple helix repeat-containing protein [Chryseosolibacter indicus]|uniref:Collagen-like protein n=1 Tax=Chryseosolibacter indicus TaxID=2782351 RepID=A0ABS5VTA5_9BACT|nr:collagen-like protein [Chryseosolibacter indicus]MBT1704667.1 hypothetical protein [Chryseosolibacter indicus]